MCPGHNAWRSRPEGDFGDSRPLVIAGSLRHRLRHDDVRRQPAFQEELARQRKISEQDFVSLADRMDRVISLQTLYEKVPIVRTALKLKILRRIREETLSDKLPHVHEAPAMDNTPPPEQTYGEWLEEQNRLA